MSLLSGCSSGGTKTDLRQELGKAEERLDLIAWPGLVENGSTDPEVNWVGSFQDRTGCKVNVKTANSVDEMQDLIMSKAYDGVSAPGEVAGSLMSNKNAEPINTKLIHNYSGVVPGLRDAEWNSKGGQAYGVPLGRSASQLAWRSDVSPKPTELRSLFDPASPYRGKIMMRDDPLSLAAAALSLRSTQPDLGIENPYALSKKQFAAAIETARVAEQVTNLYWTDYTEQVRAMEQNSSTVGLAAQSVVSLTATRGTKVETALPSEGTVGSSDTWMLLKGAKHPSCMYRWMDHVLDPQVNAAISEYYGQAPSVTRACDYTEEKGFCDTFHATDEGYYDNIWFATTPQARCIDDADRDCVAFKDWQRAWQQLRQG